METLNAEYERLYRNQVRHVAALSPAIQCTCITAHDRAVCVGRCK